MEQGLRYLPVAARKHPFPMPGYGAWMQDDVSPKYRSGPEGRAALVTQGPPPNSGGHLPSGVPAFAKAFSSAPNAMARRNERERKRVRLVNNGFNTLRAVLPQNKNTKKKLSKMETLRSAIEYINDLQRVLHSQPQASGGSFGDDSSPWPVWEEAMGWDARTSPASAGSSPQTCLSPDELTLDFSAYP